MSARPVEEPQRRQRAGGAGDIDSQLRSHPTGAAGTERAVPRQRATAVVAAALALLLAHACSTLPAPTRPHFADHHVAAEFVVPPDGQLALPSSSPELVVHELALDPPPLAERFADAVRYFAYAPGTRVTVRSRFRTWAPPGAEPARAADVLRGAQRLRALDAP